MLGHVGCALAGRDGGSGSGRRKVGLDRNEIVEGGALIVGEAGADAVRVESGLALLGRQVAEFAKGSGHGAASIRRKTGELSHGPTNLLTLFRGEALHRFRASDHALTLCRGHIIQLREAVAHALLNRGREIAETGLPLQSPLLFWQRKTAMPIHPLREMLLIPLRSDGGVGGRSWSATCPGLGDRRAGKGNHKERSPKRIQDPP